MRQIDWKEFVKLRGHEKRPYFEKDGRPFHIIMAQQFDREFLDEICALATKTRGIAKSQAGRDFLNSLLRNRRAMLYFAQPSSRTYLSFGAACQILGLSTLDVRDLATSSEAKGESQEDSVRTFSSYVDLIIMRHYSEGLAERMAWTMNFIGRPIPIINAGSGKDQHPTQALLDIYTLHRSFENYGGIEGKKIAMVGDLQRGRTVRSLSYLLRHYPGVKIYFVAPSQLQIGDDLKEYLREHNVPFEQRDDLIEVIPLVDAVYMTRIQDEHGKIEGLDLGKYKFEIGYLQLLGPNAVILHPLPRRDEIPVEVDNDKRAMYWRQERNGMWVRVALIAMIFGKDAEILRY